MRFHPHHRRGGGGGGSYAGGGAGVPMPEKSSTEFIVLDVGQLHFEREDSRLRLRVGDDGELRDVHLFRLFPHSEPDGWISVLDEKGGEIGLIRELSGLDREARDLVRGALCRRYVVPRIERIMRARERFDLVEFDVWTDRGERRILIRDVRDSIQMRDPSRFVITDVDGNFYEVPNAAKLDSRSRVLLARYV